MWHEPLAETVKVMVRDFVSGKIPLGILVDYLTERDDPRAADVAELEKQCAYDMEVYKSRQDVRLIPTSYRESRDGSTGAWLLKPTVKDSTRKKRPYWFIRRCYGEWVKFLFHEIK